MPTPVFGDNVRIRQSSETEALGLSGKFGSVSGFTTPSVTGVNVIGGVSVDYALGVILENRKETYWFAPDLLEFVDQAPGTEMWIAGAPTKSVRSERGEWLQVPGLLVEVWQDNLRSIGKSAHHMAVPISLVLVAIALWFPLILTWAPEWLAADRCLDAGGSFDYARMECDFNSNHPYVPFAARHWRLVETVPLAILGSAVCLAAAIARIWSMRRRERAG